MPSKHLKLNLCQIQFHHSSGMMDAPRRGVIALCFHQTTKSNLFTFVQIVRQSCHANKLEFKLSP